MNANFNLLNENRKAHRKNICVSSKAQWLSQKKKKKTLTATTTITGRREENSNIRIHMVLKQSNKSLCSINNKTFLENQNLCKLYYLHS